MIKITAPLLAVSFLISSNAFSHSTDHVHRYNDELRSAKIMDSKQALDNDLRIIAQKNGWSVTQAYYKWHVVKEAKNLAKSLRKSNKMNYTGIEVSNDKDAKIKLYIKGKAPQEVKKILTTVNANIELFDEQPFSEAELEARANQVHQALIQEGFENLATNYVLDNPLSIKSKIVLKEKQFRSFQINQLTFKQMYHQKLKQRLNHEEFDLEFVHEDLSKNDTAYAGSLTNNGCTTAFAVRKPSGVEGVTTAAHCNEPNQYSHTIAGNQYDHEFIQQGSYHGAMGDVQWGTSNTWIPPRLQTDPDGASWRDISDIETRESMIAGEDVCFFGRNSTAIECTTIASNNFTTTQNGVTMTRMVHTQDDLASSGDSGGPWFFGSVAYGIHSGSLTSDQTDIFTPVNRLDEMLNITVLTTANDGAPQGDSCSWTMTDGAQCGPNCAIYIYSNVGACYHNKKSETYQNGTLIDLDYQLDNGN